MGVLGSDKKAVTIYLLKEQDIRLNLLTYLRQGSKSRLMREIVQGYLDNLNEDDKGRIRVLANR